MKIRPVGAHLFRGEKYRQTDRRTERRTEGQRDMTRPIVDFRNFANGAKIHSVSTDIFIVVSSMLRESQLSRVSNGLRCAWPRQSYITASVSVSLTYTKLCGKPGGGPPVLLLLHRCTFMPLVGQM